MKTKIKKKSTGPNKDKCRKVYITLYKYSETSEQRVVSNLITLVPVHLLGVRGAWMGKGVCVCVCGGGGGGGSVKHSVESIRASSL